MRRVVAIAILILPLLVASAPNPALRRRTAVDKRTALTDWKESLTRDLDRCRDYFTDTTLPIKDVDLIHQFAATRFGLPKTESLIQSFISKPLLDDSVVTEHLIQWIKEIMDRLLIEWDTNHGWNLLRFIANILHSFQGSAHIFTHHQLHLANTWMTIAIDSASVPDICPNPPITPPEWVLWSFKVLDRAQRRTGTSNVFFLLSNMSRMNLIRLHALLMSRRDRPRQMPLPDNRSQDANTNHRCQDRCHPVDWLRQLSLYYATAATSPFPEPIPCTARELGEFAHYFVFLSRKGADGLQSQFSDIYTSRPVHEGHIHDMAIFLISNLSKEQCQRFLEAWIYCVSEVGDPNNPMLDIYAELAFKLMQRFEKFATPLSKNPEIRRRFGVIMFRHSISVLQPEKYSKKAIPPEISIGDVAGGLGGIGQLSSSSTSHPQPTTEHNVLLGNILFHSKKLLTIPEVDEE